MKQVLTIIFVGVCSAFFAIFLLRSYREYAINPNRNINGGIDFLAYYTGAKLFLENPSELYTPVYQRNIQRKYTSIDDLEGLLAFLNPPLVALAFSPYTLFPIRLAYTINYFLYGVLTACYLYLNFRLLKPSLTALATLLLFIPIIVQPIHGQISLWLGFLMLAIYRTTKSNKSLLAGMLSALLLLKFQYIIAIPFIYLIAIDKRRFLAGCIGMGTILIVLNTIISSGSFPISYLKLVLMPDSLSLGTSYKDLYSLFSFFKITLKSDSFYAALLPVVLLYMLYLFALYKTHLKNNFNINFTSIILASLVLSPHTSYVDLLVLTIPMLILWRSKFLSYKMLAVLLFVIPYGTYANIQAPSSLLLYLAATLLLFSNNGKIIPTSNDHEDLLYLQRKT